MSQQKSGETARSPLQIAIGLAILALAVLYLYTAVNIRTPPVGDLLGPRFFPLMLGIVFVLLSAINIIMDIFQPTEEPEEFRLSREVKLRTALVFTSAVLYGVALPTAGYLGSTFVFLVAFLALVKFRGLIEKLFWATVMTGGFYLVFDLWLGVKLPEMAW